VFPCVKGQLSSGRSVVVLSLRQKRTVMKDSRLRHYPVLCDPLATFASLRRAGLLDGYSYLHLSPEHTEIGWAPVERLALLSGTPMTGAISSPSSRCARSSWDVRHSAISASMS
jgi:hypothetical protein